MAEKVSKVTEAKTKKAVKKAEQAADTPTEASTAKRTESADISKASEDAVTNAEVGDVVAAKDEVSTQSRAKAGKRSAKAVREAEEKAAKEERKEQDGASDASETKVRHPQKPARTRLERRGKKFRDMAKLVEADKKYALREAVELATKTSPTKFDASVELHVNLAVDPRQADQNIRGTLVLPAGTGKSVRVAVFADDTVDGADLSGIDTITALLDKQQLDFDVLIATPANMAKLGKYARVLGPRGLMPNPKSGTVTPDVAKAVQEAKAGRVEYRVDSTGIIHAGIGKVSFGADKLMQNAEALMAGIRSSKPSSIKGTYLKSVHLTTSMGPSIPVDLSSIA